MTTTKHVNKNQEKEDSLLTNVSSLSLPNWAVPHEPKQTLTSVLLAIHLPFPFVLFLYAIIPSTFYLPPIWKIRQGFIQPTVMVFLYFIDY